MKMRKFIEDNTKIFLGIIGLLVIFSDNLVISTEFSADTCVLGNYSYYNGSTFLCSPDLIGDSGGWTNTSINTSTALNVIVGTGKNLTVNGNTLFVDGTNNRIGIGTASPSYPLHIVGSSAYNQFVLGQTVTNATQRIGVSARGYNTSALQVAILYGYLTSTENRLMFGGGTTVAQAATNLRFYTAPELEKPTGTLRMIIDGNGKVGMGTETPDAQLDVQTFTSTNVGLIVQGNTGQSADLLQMLDISGNKLVTVSAFGNMNITNNITINSGLIIKNSNYDGCTVATEGTIVYNSTSHKHFACNSTAWNALY